MSQSDPMQLLSSMFEAGQEIMRKMVNQPPADDSGEGKGDAANPFLSAARQFADMQKAWLNAAAASSSETESAGPVERSWPRRDSSRRSGSACSKACRRSAST